MRASPRTWPSIRLSRLRHGALISLRMVDIYPVRVYNQETSKPRKDMPMANPTSQAKHHHPAHAHERQASAAEPSQAPVPAGTIYTCPMHPQIRQVGPGHCPICGMALEPELAGEAGPNPELVDMTRRFWIGLVLSIPVVALEMGGHLANLHMLLGGNLSNRLQFAFATPVVLWAGWPFFVRGWRSIVTRNLNMFTLIAMGTGVAYAYSLVATYFEAAAVITVLVLLGQVLELRARDQTSGAIKALIDLAPRTARRVGTDGTEAE